MARPAFRFTLNDALDVTVRAEHGQVNGDGPVARNPNIVPPRLPILRDARSARFIHAASALRRFGIASTRISYSHRDKEYISDDNRASLPRIDQIDANVTFRPTDSRWSFSAYGTNLLDKQTWVRAVLLPNSPSFGGGPGKPSPQTQILNRGRVVGAEARVEF